MTNKLATKFPEAHVIGLDIAPIPKERHERARNVTYIQGDIRELVASGPVFAVGSFDYVFQRLLVFGLSDWQEYITLITSLLRPSGWLEMQEASMQLYSGMDEPISSTWWHYPQILADASALGLDIEIGRKLFGLVESTKELSRVQETCYKFAPVGRSDAPHLAGLESQVLGLFIMVAQKICSQFRSRETVERLVDDMNWIWGNGFDSNSHLRMYVVTAEKQGTVL